MTEKKEINMFDFDGTLYPKDVQREFCFSDLFTNLEKLKFIVLQLFVVFRIISLTRLKSYCYDVYFSKPRSDLKLNKFISSVQSKIDWEFLRLQSESGIPLYIVSASFQFLLIKIFDRYTCSEVIVLGSRKNKKGFYHLIGAEKASLIKNELNLPDGIQVNFYGDSNADLEVLPFVNKFYMIKNKNKANIIGIYDGGRHH